VRGAAGWRQLRPFGRQESWNRFPSVPAKFNSRPRFHFVSASQPQPARLTRRLAAGQIEATAREPGRRRGGRHPELTRTVQVFHQTARFPNSFPQIAQISGFLAPLRPLPFSPPLTFHLLSTNPKTPHSQLHSSLGIKVIKEGER